MFFPSVKSSIFTTKGSRNEHCFCACVPPKMALAFNTDHNVSHELQLKAYGEEFVRESLLFFSFGLVVAEILNCCFRSY